MKQSGLYYFLKEQVRIILSFLKGHTVDFYLQKVSMNKYRWTLVEFFRELMDFCFLSNFSETLRKEFNTIKQDSKVI